MVMIKPSLILLSLLAVVSTASAARLTSPNAGSTLGGSSTEFRWTGDGAQVFQWHLSIGSSERGEQFYSKGFTSDVTSVTVTGLPTNGTTLFVTLYSLEREGQRFVFKANDYTFNTPLPAPPALTTPAPGSVLPSDSVTFGWQDRGTNATQWRLRVGSSSGGTEYADVTVGANVRSVDVSGLPTNGGTVWVRLSYFYINVWRDLNYQYTAQVTSTTPVIIAPGIGGTVTTVPFVVQWTPSQTNVSAWQVLVGAAQGGSEILDTGEVATSVRSAQVNALPDGTDTFWIRLRYQAGGVWEEKDYQYAYDPNGDAAPQIFSPVPSSEIFGAQVEFQWTAKLLNVDRWWIYVGTSKGDDSIFNMDMGTATKVTVNNLPTNGETLHVRLFYRVGESWNQRDHLFTTRRLPKMSFPGPGTLIAGPRINFQWDDNGVIGNAWALSVGRAKGGTDIYESGTLLSDVRAKEVQLPVNLDGEVWVRLWHLPNSLTWSYADFLYQIQGPVLPALTEPAPGSTIQGGVTERFHFAPNDTKLFAYWVYLGSEVGGRDLFNSGFINTETTFIDVDLPNEDRTIHLRLWWLADLNRWQFADYTLALEVNDSPDNPAPNITPPSL